MPLPCSSHRRDWNNDLIFLTVSDPLRLGLSWPLGTSAHRRLPQHNRVILCKKAPYALPEGWRLEPHGYRGSVAFAVDPRFKHQVDAAFTFEHSVLPVLWAAFSLLKCPAQLLLVMRNKGYAFTGQSGQVYFTQSSVAEDPVVGKAGIRK